MKPDNYALSLILSVEFGMGKHPTWKMIFVGLLFVAFPKVMLGTEYGIIVDGKLTKHGAIVGRSPEPTTTKTKPRSVSLPISCMLLKLTCPEI